MRFINNRFGHKSILLNYVGIQSGIIPGEIQHGYWYNEKWCKNRDWLNKLFPTFYWGGNFISEIVKIDNKNSEKIIGDPFLYLNSSSANFLNLRNDYWIVIPKNTSNLSELASITENKKLITDSRNNGISKAYFTLHPSETHFRNIKLLFEENGFEYLENLDLGNQNWLHLQKHRFENSPGIITNYIGPHIFRNAYLNRISFLVHPIYSDFSSVKTLSIKELNLIQKFDRSNSENTTLKNIAYREMGLDFFKSSEALYDLFWLDKNRQIFLSKLYKTILYTMRVKNTYKLFQSKKSIKIIDTRGKYIFCQHCYEKSLPLYIYKSQICRVCYNRYDELDGN